jgi:sugar phosphate isomerase/epimerase
MRFGIMEMQLDQLIPEGLPPEEALNQVTQFDRGELVSRIADQGFSLIELGGDLGLFFQNAYGEENIQRLLTLKETHHLSYTIHLPLWSVEPSTPLTPVRKGSVQAIIEIIKAAAPIDPEVYVLHATGALAAEFYRMNLPPLAKSLALKQFQSGAITSIGTILEETGIPSKKLAIETIEFPLDLTLEIADLLDLSICLDTGHVLAGFSGAVSFQEALRACLPRLAEVHLHDSPDFLQTAELGYGEDHQPLGKGSLDIDLLFSTLKRNEFNGPIIFELTLEQALQSMEFIKEKKVAK